MILVFPMNTSYFCMGYFIAYITIFSFVCVDLCLMSNILCS
jgi:hypothetical protein